MNISSTLRTVLIIGSVLFFIFIINMVRIKKLELKYALIWILTSVSFNNNTVLILVVLTPLASSK